jgi:hypothetical protein
MATPLHAAFKIGGAATGDGIEPRAVCSSVKNGLPSGTNRSSRALLEDRFRPCTRLTPNYLLSIR